ncbi:LamG-like jellyroll fold domain-containing protein [uncultured Deinococcus sp.]|uniref:LamG-like jellyroll fold domain-containing protein n=1 Tax=uncultured Deinococcus sp. TaxID=158789 RepID=UPI0025DC1226|nr:LamG-like jellyroll fold domain-containing protein [uncultured Deinococcus sp.]
MTDHRAIRPARTALLALLTAGLLGSCGGSGSTTPGGPAAPTGLTATPASATSVTVTWTPVADATGYTLERRTGTSPYVPVTLPSPTATTVTDTGLGASTTYTYHVSATTAAGTSPYSADVAVTTPAADPTAPTINGVTVVNGIVGTPEQVTVSGTATARSGTIQGVTVDWGDAGSTSSAGTSGAFTATHTYSTSGTYTVTITATDSAGRMVTDARRLQVTHFGTNSQAHVVFDGQSTPRELSGKRRTGVYTGSGCFTPVADRYGVANQAERFNTASACTVGVAGGADTLAIPLPEDFTVDLWINPNAARAGQGGWLTGQEGGAFSLTLGTDGRVSATLAAPGGGTPLRATDPAATPSNVWTQYVARVEIAGTPAQTTLQLYRKDNATDRATPARRVAEATAAGAYVLSTSRPWTVAEAQGGTTSGAGDRPFAGDVDDLRVYDRALEPYEIAALSTLDRYPKP